MELGILLDYSSWITTLFSLRQKTSKNIYARVTSQLLFAIGEGKNVCPSKTGVANLRIPVITSDKANTQVLMFTSPQRDLVLLAYTFQSLKSTPLVQFERVL